MGLQADLRSRQDVLSELKERFENSMLKPERGSECG